MAKVKSVFINGLKVLVPILVILLLIYWTYIGFERIFRGVLLLFIDPSFYFNGLGWIAAVVFTILLGLLVQIPFLRKAADRLKDLVIKLPIIKTLYRMSSDIMMFLTKKGMNQGKIVKIETDVGSILGIMTQDQIDDLPEGIGGKDEVAVYVPMSYQIGGFTFIVPKDSVEILDISVQKGIALTMTAYISGKNRIDP